MNQMKKAKQSKKQRRSAPIMSRRAFGLMLMVGVVTFLVLFWKLWQIQIVDYARYAEAAAGNQMSDTVVAANRGTIYDSKGTALAISAAVNNVVISPKDLIARQKKIDETPLKPGETAPISTEEVIRFLAVTLKINEAELWEKMANEKSESIIIAKKVEDNISDPVQEFITENKLYPGVHLKETSKRYYSGNDLASHLIGFLNQDEQGAYGLEALYNNELSGETGRIITASTAAGGDMPSNYDAYIAAQNGYNLNLTIDSNIQRYLERVLETGSERFDVLDGAFGIVMNPKTGAVLAIASLPDYDLNNRNEVHDPMAAAKLEAMKLELQAMEARIGVPPVPSEDPDVPTPPMVTQEDYDKKYEEYLTELSYQQERQWSSKAVNTTYEPGSTFKPIPVAIGLEEGVIQETDGFTCEGSILVPGHKDLIYCNNRKGHGTQDVRKVLMNSCNPALIEIGQRIGVPLFYRYMNDFGILSKTGIDMQNEMQGIFWSQDSFNGVNLATASFGQRFTVTPIRLLTSLSAVINGGYLVNPYVVQSITDQDGRVIKYQQTEVVKQVISEETSAIVRSYMESVVSGGTGKTARIEGYRIGGKTGTSQTTEEGHLIVSFVGFAPADDPEFILLVGFDHPKPARQGVQQTADGIFISGSSMAALMAKELMQDILDYMEIPRQGDNYIRDVSVPNLKGKTVEQAQAALSKSTVGLTFKTVGSGDKVTDQVPASNVMIPKGSSVILYLGEQKPDAKVVVPDVFGLTYSAAKAKLENKGFYMRAPGVENAPNMVAFTQSIEAGAEVPAGTVVEVSFRDNTAQRD